MLLDVLGTAGTLALLAALLMALGVRRGAARNARPRAACRSGARGRGSALWPSSRRTSGSGASLHGATPERFALVEERSCVNALVDHGDTQMLHLNAAAQNGYPYDDFHMLIGLFPALLHPHPQRSLAVGLGIGATPYGMLLDPRMRSVETVEICAGLGELLAELGERGAHESQRLLEDPRLDLRVGDGRKRLLAAEQPYDVITVDALRPQSGYSGNVYSVEFYELVASRLGARTGCSRSGCRRSACSRASRKSSRTSRRPSGRGPRRSSSRATSRCRPTSPTRSRGFARGRTTARYRPSSARRSSGSSSTRCSRTCAAASRAPRHRMPSSIAICTRATSIS